MYECGYLKTPPGLLTTLAVTCNVIAFICVITTEEKESIHGGFLIAVTILGFFGSLAIIICHVIQPVARKIPPYPFALAQVIGGILLCVINWAATGALLSEYNKIPALVATAIFSIISGFLHLLQSIWLCRAIKVTQIAREAINFGNSVIGGDRSSGEVNPNLPPEAPSNETVAYQKDRENVVLDPTQTVY